MAVDKYALRADIDGTPELAAAMAAEDVPTIIKHYKKPDATATVPVSYMFNKRTLYRNLGMATVLPIVAALEAQTADPDPMTALKAKEVLLLLNDLIPGGGVDASHAETQAMCEELVTAGAMSQATCDEIMSWGKKPASVGFAKFGENVSRADVIQAIAI